jgi:hypothetical protein
MEIKYDRGERVTLEAETSGIRKKVGLMLKRRGCQRASEIAATTSLGK